MWQAEPKCCALTLAGAREALSAEGTTVTHEGAVTKAGMMVRRKVFKRIAQNFPLNSVRVWALRFAGYRVGRQVYVGEGLVVVDDLDQDREACVLTIGDRVAISPRVTVVLTSYPNNSRLRGELGESLGSVTIGADSWIGTGAIILPNVAIGELAVVAAGAVVRADVSSRVVVGGVPARVIRNLDAPHAEAEFERVDVGC